MTAYVVRGHKRGELTNPEDIVYEKETKGHMGIVSCAMVAFRKGANVVLIMKKEYVEHG